MNKQFTKFEFKGTAKDFEENKITLNGARLDQIAVGTLGKHGLIECLGDGPKPLRGRTPKLYKAVSGPGMVFEHQNT